jgi:hypothetical protein
MGFSAGPGCGSPAVIPAAINRDRRLVLGKPQSIISQIANSCNTDARQGPLVHSGIRPGNESEVITPQAGTSHAQKRGGMPVTAQ